MRGTMGNGPIHQITIEFDADDNWWVKGRSTLQAVLADAQRDDPTIAETRSPAVPLANGDTARGVFGDILLDIAIGSLGGVLTQWLLYICTLPGRLRNVQMIATPRNQQLVPSAQPIVLKIDLQKARQESREQLQEDVANDSLQDDSIAQDINKWLVVTIAHIPQPVITVRME